MQSLQLRNETLVEIATFLVRRWSQKEKIVVEFSDKMETRTRLNENRVILTPLEKRIGNNFQRYRQFRTSLWYEAMRIRFCKKLYLIMLTCWLLDHSCILFMAKPEL